MKIAGTLAAFMLSLPIKLLPNFYLGSRLILFFNPKQGINDLGNRYFHYILVIFSLIRKKSH
jgi:hypothetical protein